MGQPRILPPSASGDKEKSDEASSMLLRRRSLLSEKGLSSLLRLSSLLSLL